MSKPKGFTWIVPESAANLCQALAQACGWDAEISPAKDDENVVVLRATEKKPARRARAKGKR